MEELPLITSLEKFLDIVCYSFGLLLNQGMHLRNEKHERFYTSSPMTPYDMGCVTGKQCNAVEPTTLRYCTDNVMIQIGYGRLLSATRVDLSAPHCQFEELGRT
jgi:hypothetical protein